MRKRASLALAAGAALALVLAACSDDDGGDGNGDGGSGDGGDGAQSSTDVPLIYGTTDTVTNVDPAAHYDNPTRNIVNNVYQRLLWVPLGETDPVPEAAESCDWDDDVTYTCTIKQGLLFSDGSELTAENVVYSYERNMTIEHESNGWQLLAGIESVEAVDDYTVTFHLTGPDSTFPYILTTPQAAIVPMSYPPDAPQPNDQVIGSGPYTIESFDATQQIQLGLNENYAGERQLNNSGAVLQFYQQESALKQAIEEGEVMVAYRSLNVTDIEDLEENGAERGVELIRGEGLEINYMAMQLNRPPFDEPAVRQAIAHIIDRQAIAESLYGGTVKPLYGPVPEGLPGHVESFKEEYGAEPDVEMAQQLIEDAGVETPIEFDLWWMPDRYGAEIGDMYGEIERQLEDTGLFDITLQELSWAQYSTTFSDGSMDAFDLGWFADYPDSTNYIGPFYDSENSFLGTGYENEQMDQLIETMRTSIDTGPRIEAVEEAAPIVAEEAPVIYLWQRDQIAAVREGVEGVEQTLDPSFVFYYHVVTPVQE